MIFRFLTLNEINMYFSIKKNNKITKTMDLKPGDDSSYCFKIMQ